MAASLPAVRHTALAAGLALTLAAGPVAAQGPAGLTALAVPSKVAAAAYGPNPAATCPTYGVTGTVIDDLGREAARRNQAAPATDGRLCAMATILLDWKSDEPPPLDALLFLARGLGLVAPPLQVVLTTFETDDPRDIARALAGGLLDTAAKAGAPQIGLASKRAGKRMTRVVLLAQDPSVELAPLPRTLPLGGAATFQGTLLGGWERPAVVVSDAQGSMKEWPAQAGKDFKAELRCGDRPGQIVVVLRGEKDGQERRLANVPVRCGGEPPASFELVEKAWPADPAAQARLVLEQVNAERAAAGLTPLAWDDEVARVALSLAEDLADEQLKGTSSGVPVMDRLIKVGQGSPLVLQNPGQAATARRAAEAFLESPVHRANLMNPEITNGGVGVVIRQGANGQPTAFVTELFTRVLPELDPAKVRAEVRAGLMERRAAAKATALAMDATLDEVAQRYAEAMAAAGGNVSDAESEKLTGAVARKYKEINLVPGAKADPMEFAAEPTLLGKSGKGLGVGAARGKHPVLGKNAVYVVVITATKR
ncbi:MAG: CAP domain-containing protein [Anaeromyxobacteraceae bacterium]|nr:CAP domain-containing protein [Anaeromyxobacteraceae bacterium]